MSHEKLREKHGDAAVDLAVQFMGDKETAVLFPDLNKLYAALKGQRDGLRPSQVVLVGQILRRLVDEFYGGDVQAVVYLLKAVAAPKPPRKPAAKPPTEAPEA